MTADVLRRNNVRTLGRVDGQPMLFAHGYGCDQNMWRLVTPRFADRYRVVLFDYVGAGDSDVSAYDSRRYSSLDGYAQDVLEVCAALDLQDVIFVGHSVSSVIGMLAARAEPERFAALVLLGPSARYLDDPESDPPYVGGFTAQDITELLESLDSNYLGWSSAIAPVIMGNEDRPELGEELTRSFCRTDPAIAARFARVTFLSDNRADLRSVRVPSVVLQCSNDAIAPVPVGRFVADAIPDCRFVLLDATGHCPHLSAPEQTADAIDGFLADRLSDRSAPLR